MVTEMKQKKIDSDHPQSQSFLRYGSLYSNRVKIKLFFWDFVVKWTKTHKTPPRNFFYHKYVFITKSIALETKKFKSSVVNAPISRKKKNNSTEPIEFLENRNPLVGLFITDDKCPAANERFDNNIQLGFAIFFCHLFSSLDKRLGKKC